DRARNNVFLSVCPSKKSLTIWCVTDFLIIACLLRVCVGQNIFDGLYFHSLKSVLEWLDTAELLRLSR
ncbi:hypothetical protein BV898_10624, partial [Hypsibius exemplaris]